MYWQEEGEDAAKLKQDILDDLEEAAGTPAYIVASCESIPDSNKKGDNPPHAKAREAYQTIVESGHFLCTQEHPGEDAPEPILFQLGEEGLEYVAPDSAGTRSATKAAFAPSLAAAAEVARGGRETPQNPTGYGK